MKLAHCYLKVRRLSASEVALERVLLAADEALETFASMGVSANNSSGGGGGAGSNSGTNASSTNKESSAAGFSSGEWRRVANGTDSNKVGSLTSLTSVVAVVKSTDFLVLRAKCRLLAGDPVTALQWATIALAVCTDSHQSSHLVLGKLHYLRGRCFQYMVKRAWEDDAKSSSSSNTSGKPVGYAIDVAACGASAAVSAATATQSAAGDSSSSSRARSGAANAGSKDAADSDAEDEDYDTSDMLDDGDALTAVAVATDGSSTAPPQRPARSRSNVSAKSIHSDGEDSSCPFDPPAGGTHRSSSRGAAKRSSSSNNRAATSPGSCSTGGVSDAGTANYSEHGDSHTALPWMSESDLADWCTGAFEQAQTHYRLADDAYYQAKCLARTAEMQLSRLFRNAGARRIPADKPAVAATTAATTS
eukprot:11386-Heterococcus_DN1.PRE.1